MMNLKFDTRNDSGALKPILETPVPKEADIQIKPPKELTPQEAEELFKSLEQEDVFYPPVMQEKLPGLPRDSMPDWDPDLMPGEKFLYHFPDSSSEYELKSSEMGSEFPDAITFATPEENIEKQDKEIEHVENGDKELETTQEKGNYGEMKMDQDMRKNGYERISTDMVTGLNDSGHQGIDGVYYNPEGNPQYIVADAKFGSAQLSDTQDGKQMSANWIDKRLDASVGKEKADEIRMEQLLNPDNVGSYVVHIDEKGNTSYDKIDSDGNTVEKDVKINE
ncbi:hypothetical protein AALB39_25910 [Lachnospiraceae bacterium 54-53]